MELLRQPERRQAFGEAGRAHASEHFAVEQMVERVNAVYLAALACRAPDRWRVAGVSPPRGGINTCRPREKRAGEQ